MEPVDEPTYKRPKQPYPQTEMPDETKCKGILKGFKNSGTSLQYVRKENSVLNGPCDSD